VSPEVANHFSGNEGLDNDAKYKLTPILMAIATAIRMKGLVLKSAPRTVFKK
jgi:hypothetical protein